jgi:Flp pilus assembly protein TadD
MTIGTEARSIGRNGERNSAGAARVRAALAAGSGALLLMLAACSGDDTARTNESPVVIASAEPVRAEPMSPVAAETAVPVRTDVTYEKAETVFRRGRYDEARALFDVVVVNRPEDASGHYLLGLSAWKTGDHEGAERALRRAAELDGASVKVRTNLARVLLEQGRAQEAVVHLEQAVDLAPESHEVWRVLGNAYSQLNRPDDAEQSYREALLLNDEDAWTMNNYGLLLIREGRFDEALLPLARAVELMPRSATFRNNLGVALERTGDLGGAEQAFMAAVEADSTYAKARISLERVSQLLGTDERVYPDLAELARRFVEQMQTWTGEEYHDC